MPIDPLSAFQTGANVLGGLFSGLSSGGAQKRQEKLQKRGVQLNEELGRRGANLEEGKQAVDYSRMLEASPLRDRVMYNIMQRVGAPSYAFRPNDIFNPGMGGGPPQLGGVDRDALAQATMGYRPGAGGVNPAVTQRAMEVLGYRPGGEYMSPRYRHDIDTGGVDPYGIAAHGYGPEDRHDYKPGGSGFFGAQFTPDGPGVSIADIFARSRKLQDAALMNSGFGSRPGVFS